MTGSSQFLASNQGIMFTFLKPPDERPPIQEVAGEMMGKLNYDSGRDGVPAAVSGARDQHRRDQSESGAVRFRGLRRESQAGLRRRREADGEAARVIRDFSRVSSDYYNNTPNLDIDIRRDQAKIYGVSEARILALLRNAYSQNYLYLIKKPEDQYQVILEVEDAARAKPEDLSLLYIKSDDGKRLVPLNELVTWKSTLGPQAVNHLNQFTSVTLVLQSQARRGDRRCDRLHQQGRRGSRAADACAPSLQGEALTFQQHRARSDDPDGAGRVRHVRDPGDSLRKLSPSADRALDVADGAGRRSC